MKAIISIILLAMTVSLSGQKINLIAESAVIEKIGTGYSFT
jgi:gluconolactonase